MMRIGATVKLGQRKNRILVKLNIMFRQLVSA